MTGHNIIPPSSLIDSLPSPFSIDPTSNTYRAVAWHLHAGKERSDLDGQQWKTHSEDLESKLAEGQATWAKKEQHFQQQINDINVRRMTLNPI